MKYEKSKSESQKKSYGIKFWGRMFVNLTLSSKYHRNIMTSLQFPEITAHIPCKPWTNFPHHQKHALQALHCPGAERTQSSGAKVKPHQDLRAAEQRWLLCTWHPHQRLPLSPRDKIIWLVLQGETPLFHLSSPHSSHQVRSFAELVGLAAARVKLSQNHVSVSVHGFSE